MPELVVLELTFKVPVHVAKVAESTSQPVRSEKSPLAPDTSFFFFLTLDTAMKGTHARPFVGVLQKSNSKSLR